MAEWELIEGGFDTGAPGATERLQVEGGYLYRSVWRFAHTRFSNQEGSGIAFAPDPTVFAGPPGPKGDKGDAAVSPSSDKDKS